MDNPTSKKPINYNLSSDEEQISWLTLKQLPLNIIHAMEVTHVDKLFDLATPGKCVEVSRYLCDKINKVEPNSAIVVCCRGFWRDNKFEENDLYAYQAHQFVLYQKKYFIDMTLKQFDKHLPCPLVRTVKEGHIGCYKEICQTYPEITDLNYKGLDI